MMTTLPKHHGQHAGLLALLMLAVSVVVVWATQPRAPERPSSEPVTPVGVSVPQRLPAPVLKIESSIPSREQPTHSTASGFVTYDEARTSHVYSPVSGWLEKVRSKTMGRRVRQFEVLAVVHSPEVYLATRDLIAELETFKDQERLDAARHRLVRWGMPKPTLDRIEATRKPQFALPLVTRVAGTIVAEDGKRAELVTSHATELFTVTDPARRHAFFDVPAAEAARVRVGAPAKLTIEGLARPIIAKVGYVWRRVEDGKRTVRVDIYSPRVVIQLNATATVVLALEDPSTP